MKLIKDFFEKLKKHIDDTEGVKRTIIDEIASYAHVTLRLDQVKIENKKIRLTCSPIQRSEIFMNKEAILSQIKEKLPSLIISDIN